MMDEHTIPTKREIELGEQDYGYSSKRLCLEQYPTLQYCNFNSPPLQSSDNFTLNEVREPEDVNTATFSDNKQPNLLNCEDYFENAWVQPQYFIMDELMDDMGPQATDFSTLPQTEVSPASCDMNTLFVFEPENKDDLNNTSQITQTPGVNGPGLQLCEDRSTLPVHGTAGFRSDDQSKSDDTGYDICFGVVTATPIISSHGCSFGKLEAVKLKACGTILKMYYEITGKYAGILAMPALCDLLESYTIKLRGHLATAKPEKLLPGAGRGKAKPNRVPEYSLRIAVYGLFVEKNAVCKFLSDSELYLQHPSGTECDLSVDYFNPHYLVRPGGEMPRLEELSLDEHGEQAEPTRTLDDTTKGRLLRMFDQADGGEVEVDANPSSRLQTPLMEHQIKALSLMIERESGRLHDLKSPSLWLQVPDETGKGRQYRHAITGVSSSDPVPVSGGILADEMGLGKTLSLLALICSRLDSLQAANVGSEEKPRTTLIVTPKSTLYGWQTQIARHIGAGQVSMLIYHGSDRRRLSSQFKDVDIVLTTYEILRSEHTLKGPLYSQLWWRVVLDEAHHIRNRESQAFEACCQVRAQYRWCLTGTPVQNSLDDFGALLCFLNVYPFQDKRQFDRLIAAPFHRSEKNAINVLRRLVTATCLRRTKARCNLSTSLPPRYEKTQHVNLLPKDQELYDFFKKKIQGIVMGKHRDDDASRAKQSKRPNILSLITLLRRVCGHAKLLPQSAIDSWTRGEKGLYDGETEFLLSPTRDMDDEDIEAPEAVSTGRRQTPEEPTFATLPEKPQGEQSANTTIVSQIGEGTESMEGHPPHSAKIEALLKNLNREQAEFNGPQPPKSVVFSSWTKMLDQVEQALRATGFNYQRIDGQSSLRSRSDAMRLFSEDSNCAVMLASIGSAGEGVDFTAAQFVHLLEPHWNPMAEAQAVDRVHRIGQTSPVTITRYIVPRSVETYIQWVQTDKLRVISLSFDTLEDAAEMEEKRWRKLESYLQ
ncbi:hypothetical protein F4809DRAFT_590021 [Biscogniauxia mediterranea]|nr:hypothetical protein F4809DRAFT_590021 [Biscogniauxia mediterranea]